MLHVIFDNTVPVSPRVQALIGINNFARLIFRRRTLADWLRGAVRQAGLKPPIELNGEEDWAAFEARLRRGEWDGDMFLLCPSHVVSRKPPEAVSLFLRQAESAPSSLLVPVGGGADWSGWALLSPHQMRAYMLHKSEGDLTSFFDDHRQTFVRVDDRLALTNLDDEVALLNYLSEAFDARFFNAIARTDYVVTKVSVDKAKLEREFNYFRLIPPEMQMFFVQPFDFRDEGGRASYRMERLHVPDTALQWLHRAIEKDEFSRFLDQVFYFLKARKRRPSDRQEVDAHLETLFVTKVRERIAALRSMPQYEALRPLLERVCGDINHLLERYLDLFAKQRRHLPADHLVIGHGDLCFSNILYGKASQLMKLIDPRGANSEADLWTHPYYDLAKLSHSIIGSYDLINHDAFDIKVDQELRLRLVLDREPPDWARPLLEARLLDSGFDPALVRLCEASLFISMLPLHSDRPSKVLGFAINAVDILDSLQSP